MNGIKIWNQRLEQYAKLIGKKLLKNDLAYQEATYNT